MTNFTPFDAADYLDDEETMAEYLTAALEDPNPDVFLAAVRDVARAHGMAQLARESGLGRESLYKALTPGAKPRYDTILKLLHVLGIKLTASPSSEQAPRPAGASAALAANAGSGDRFSRSMRGPANSHCVSA
jgi:probable addiction module antidote protein